MKINPPTTAPTAGAPAPPLDATRSRSRTSPPAHRAHDTVTQEDLALEDVFFGPVGELAPPTSVVGPPLARQAQLHADLRALLQTHGFDPPAEGEPILIGLRGLDPQALAEGRIETHPTLTRQAADDTMVLLYVDDEGNDRVAVSEGATHPFVAEHESAPNADGEGLRDVATLRPGHYELRRERYGGYDTALVVTAGTRSEQVPVWRDLDQDGRISDQERSWSEAPASEHSGVELDRRQRNEDLQLGPEGAYGTGIYLHPDWRSPVLTDGGRPFSSIGCQTAPEDFVALVSEHIGGGAETYGDYYLIDVGPQSSTRSTP